MLVKFWEGIGDRLSENWIHLLFGPAFLFWGGGIGIIIWKIGFYQVWNWMSTRDVPTELAVLVLGVLILSVSSAGMQYVRFFFLRLLEGYWFWPFNYLALLAIRFNRWKILKDRKRWNVLMDKKDSGMLTFLERRELANLEIRGHYSPADLNDCMPTSLGNILCSAETAPRHKYGLDPVICWPRFWLLLSKDMQETLNASRQQLDTMVELFSWGVFFLVWVIWWRWAILVSLVWIVCAYLLAIQSATVYADLIEATFDTKRFILYESVYWPLPKKTGEIEITIGKQLTAFLWRGYTEKPIEFSKH